MQLAFPGFSFYFMQIKEFSVFLFVCYDYSIWRLERFVNEIKISGKFSALSGWMSLVKKELPQEEKPQCFSPLRKLLSLKLFLS